jgi:hypothetical protein
VNDIWAVIERDVRDHKSRHWANNWRKTEERLTEARNAALQSKNDFLAGWSSLERDALVKQAKAIRDYANSPLLSPVFGDWKIPLFGVDIRLEMIGYSSDVIQSGIRGGCLPRINKKLNLFAVQTSPFINVIREGGNVAGPSMSSGVVKNQILEATEYFERCDELKQPAIHKAIERNNHAAVASSPEMRYVDPYGFTPALLACSVGLADLIPILLKCKADFSSATHHGLTPLLAALQTPNRHIAQMLLENRSILGDLNCCPESGMTALHWAVLYDFADLAAQLLDGGANPMLRTQFDDYTPIHIAAKSGNAVKLSQHSISSFISISHFFSGLTHLKR